MKEIDDDPDLRLQVIATGMHLSPEFGLTYKAIEKDGFPIDEKVEMLLSSDTSVGIAKSIGLGVIGFADALDRLKPDIMVVLGDRYEIFAAAQAAMMLTIPIAHISGGELTQGAIDENIRHAITKMAQYHFVANELYRKRVIQIGEQPQNVFNVGDPGLDNIKRIKLLSKEDLQKRLAFDLENTFFLVTYHPATLGNRNHQKSVENLISALDYFPHVKILFTKANADAGGRVINQILENYSAKQPERVLVVTSLGQLLYLSAMKHCEAVIGNSSSGIVEAPALKKASVNIGDRQTGRLKASSIIDCNDSKVEIIKAISVAISPNFKEKLSKTVSLYGDSNASIQIKERLKQMYLPKQQIKEFYDISFSLESKQ
jgi:UDP-N-acetylglucosamine 2-epimerase (non-hydrolysing)/GDP/UDP-N,N'-diacetylbacillosamine 2-epimerase (hydrolysing)